MKKTPTPKITVTKNYRLFERSQENRPLNLKKHKHLYNSMQKYGFLSCFPIACSRNGNSRLEVKDGQHRLAFAEELSLPVPYVVESTSFDIADVNSTPRTWGMSDFADKWINCGKKDYKEGQDFAELHGIPLSLAFSLLAGTVNYSNVADKFKNGEFKVKDREFANVVAAVYSHISSLSKDCRNRRSIEACVSVCRVKGFDPKRFMSGADRCRHKLVAYSTRDAYLEMFEEIYNFGRKQLFPLKVSAIQTMKDRAGREKQVNENQKGN